MVASNCGGSLMKQTSPNLLDGCMGIISDAQGKVSH